eukprot:11178344-Lingulodinium_polyedra.AAC.1
MHAQPLDVRCRLDATTQGGLIHLHATAGGGNSGAGSRMTVELGAGARSRDTSPETGDLQNPWP